MTIRNVSGKRPVLRKEKAAKIKPIIIDVTAYLMLDLLISLLFFRSWLAVLFLLPGMAVYLRQQQKQRRKKELLQMQEQFLSGMRYVLTALQTGYAMENAFREAEAQLRTVYPSDTFILRELHYINRQTSLNVPVEQLLLDLAQRSGAEDIRQFAEIFHIARRSGGDMIAIVRNTIAQITLKEDTAREIDTILAGKKTEQTIMSLIPLLILGYVSLTSPSFLSGLYHTVPGVVTMLCALAVYAAAWLWGRKIMDIQV